VAVEPIVLGDRRLGAAVAETVIAPASRRIETTLGPVEIVERYASTGPADDGLSFTASGPDGSPLVEVRIDIDVLEAHRSRFLKRTLALALVPIPIALTLVALILASRRTTPALGRPWRRSLRFVLAATS